MEPQSDPPPSPSQGEAPSWQRPFTRRRFIGHSAGVALAIGGVGSFVAACGDDDDDGGGGGSGEVVVLSWVSYVTPEIKTAFEDAYPGITMRGVAAQSDQEMFTKVKAGGGEQYDLVFCNAGWAPLYHDNGLTEPFDIAKVGGADELYPVFVEDTSFPYVVDPGNVLLYPNAWSPLSMTYSKTAPFQPPQPYTWNSMWSDEVEEGKVVLQLGAGDDFLAVAGLAQGFQGDDVYSMTGQDLRNAEEYLGELAPFKLAKSDPEFRQFITSDEAWIGLSATLAAGALINEEAKEDLAESVVPEEGAPGWVDGPQLVKGAKNKANAQKFMKWFGTDPDNLVYLFDEYGTAPCNRAHVERLKAEGGNRAKRLEQLQAEKPELATKISWQRQPDDPEAWTAACDRVQASL
jgi:spermidine/putrescine transport system substrate-binding protein